uniref:Uncharacterized protein n=1 Tax=Rhizophagus irregularis (strain DAOM 181602 / DAOM 197198 / MUCL 43194) TaxID=747089 RepID=U9SP59_RHIID
MSIRSRNQGLLNRRIRRRITRRQIPTNNANMFLTLAAQLPLQITNDPFSNQLFNGNSFHFVIFNITNHQ